MNDTQALTVGDLLAVLSRLPKDATLRLQANWSDGKEEAPMWSFGCLEWSVVVDEGEVRALVFLDPENADREPQRFARKYRQSLGYALDGEYVDLSKYLDLK